MAQQGIGKLFSVVGAGTPCARAAWAAQRTGLTSPPPRRLCGRHAVQQRRGGGKFWQRRRPLPLALDRKGGRAQQPAGRRVRRRDAPPVRGGACAAAAAARGSGHASHLPLCRIAQVAALSALVSGAALRSGVTASAAAPSSAVSNALVLGGVGALGAAVLLRVGGLGMDEVMYVSRATFKSGVATLGGGLQSVTAALGRVRAALSERIDALTSRVEEGLAQQEALARVAAETHDGVGALCEQMGAVEGKLDGVQAKQDFACRGIYLLCSVVSQTIKDGGGAQAQAGHDARGFAKLAPAGAAAANSGSASLLELLGANPPASAAATPHLAPLTGTVQEQLAAISSLAAINCQLEAPTVQAR